MSGLARLYRNISYLVISGFISLPFVYIGEQSEMELFGNLSGAVVLIAFGVMVYIKFGSNKIGQPYVFLFLFAAILVTSSIPVDAIKYLGSAVLAVILTYFTLKGVWGGGADKTH